MARLLEVLASGKGPHTPGILQHFCFLTEWRPLILTVDWIVGCTTVTLHSNLVLLAHALFPVVLVVLLVLHELPARDVTLHRILATLINLLLLYLSLQLPLLPVVLCEVFVYAVEWPLKVARRWVGLVHLGVVHEFVEAADVFPRPHILNKAFVTLCLLMGRCLKLLPSNSSYSKRP